MIKYKMWDIMLFEKQKAIRITENRNENICLLIIKKRKRRTRWSF